MIVMRPRPRCRAMDLVDRSRAPRRSGRDGVATGEGDPRGDGVEVLREGEEVELPRGGREGPERSAAVAAGAARHATPRLHMRASSPRGAAGFRIRLPVTAAAPSSPVRRLWC